MRLVDRLLLRRIVSPFAATTVTIICIMSLENMSRLLALLEHVRSPAAMLGRLMLLLLPEYVAIGLLVGVFLSVALALRNAVLAGEWQILAGIGLSPARLMIIPAAFGLMCGAAQLVVRLQLQPLGEQRLEALGADIKRGAYGLGAAVGDIKLLPDGIVLSVDGVDRRSGDLLGLFLQTREGVFTARSAKASYDARGDLQLSMRNGVALLSGTQARRGSVMFATYAMHVPMEGVGAVRTPVRTALDRLTLKSLVDRIRSEARPDGKGGAMAALMARCSYAGFTLMLPFLAMALAVPPPRSRSVLGIFVGVLMIVAFIKSATLVETRFANQAVLAFSLFLLGWSLLTGLLWRAEASHGPGACEAWLERNCAQPFALLIEKLRAATHAPRSRTASDKVCIRPKHSVGPRPVSRSQQ